MHLTPREIEKVLIYSLAEVALISIRARMRDRGLMPPEVPRALAAVLPAEV